MSSLPWNFDKPDVEGGTIHSTSGGSDDFRMIAAEIESISSSSAATRRHHDAIDLIFRCGMVTLRSDGTWTYEPTQ